MLPFIGQAFFAVAAITLAVLADIVITGKSFNNKLDNYCMPISSNSSSHYYLSYFNS
jgi:hypothetical protein